VRHDEPLNGIAGSASVPFEITLGRRQDRVQHLFSGALNI